MREFTVPPLATATPVGGLADTVFEHAAEDPDRVVLVRKDAAGRWQDVTSAEFRDQVLALAKGLLAEGVRFGDRVGIMSRTRYEWTLFDFALWCVGAQSVPVYPTSSAEQLRWMLYDSGATACLVEHEEHAMTIGSVIDRLPRLQRLWQLDAGAEAALYAAGESIDPEVVRRHRMATTPDTPATVIYTSGTTGRPRGCLITHSNFMTETDNIVRHYGRIVRPQPQAGHQASTLLFLPLSHVLGRMAQVAAIRAGVKIGHQPSLSTEALLADLASLRPSYLVAVPSIFERLFDAVRRQAEREGRLTSFDKAADLAVRYAEAMEHKAFGGPGPSPALRMRRRLYDKLVFSQVRKALGGRCRHAMTGGAALDRRLGLFFDGAGIRIFEGYGLTETTAAAVANPSGRPRFGTVGRPIPGTSVRIAADSEVWLQGGQVFTGYLNDPQATQAVLRNGWLATGDLGELDEEGYLTITGRKREVLVTSSGKTISPVPLEQRIRNHPLVAQCLVLGNDRPYISALITLDPEAVAHWLSMRRRPGLSPAELVQDRDLENEIRRAVISANSQVSQAEAIRAFRVLATQFTEAQGLLTPSLKPKRKAIEQFYAAEIEALYQHNQQRDQRPNPAVHGPLPPQQHTRHGHESRENNQAEGQGNGRGDSQADKQDSTTENSRRDSRDNSRQVRGH